MKIKIKADNDFNVPRQAHSGEWFDLSAAKDYHLMAGDSAIIDLGVCIKIPRGYEAILAPRSSTFKRYKVIQTNSIGVIDNSYCGDNDKWGLPVYATDKIFIPAGARIAQFRIQKVQPKSRIKRVLSMKNKNRGGFGSTGL